MNPARAIASKVISAALFAVMQALIRLLGARYPIGQVVFYRSVFAIIPVVLVYAWRGSSPPSRVPSGRSDKRAGVY